jgi:hypothetical protein
MPSAPAKSSGLFLLLSTGDCGCGERGHGAGRPGAGNNRPTDAARACAVHPRYCGNADRHGRVPGSARASLPPRERAAKANNTRFVHYTSAAATDPFPKKRSRRGGGVAGALGHDLPRAWRQVLTCSPTRPADGARFNISEDRGRERPITETRPPFARRGFPIRIGAWHTSRKLHDHLQRIKPPPSTLIIGRGLPTRWLSCSAGTTSTPPSSRNARGSTCISRGARRTTLQIGPRCPPITCGQLPIGRSDERGFTLHDRALQRHRRGAGPSQEPDDRSRRLSGAARMSPDELIELRQRVTSSRSASVARRAANAPRLAPARPARPLARRAARRRCPWHRGIASPQGKVVP